MAENINDLIRRFLPKGNDFDNTGEETVQKIKNCINNRSRKVPCWKSPNDFLMSAAL